MAVTITRSQWVDDDGSGTTGTVINNAVKTSIYNEIDGALAKVAQLAGGNTFSGTQNLPYLTTYGFGAHTIVAAGTGGQTLAVQNTAAGPGNFAGVYVFNDLSKGALLQCFASTYTSAGINVADGVTLVSTGAGGLSIATSAAAPLRLYTNSVARLQIDGTGYLSVNGAPNYFGQKFGVQAGGAGGAAAMMNIPDTTLANFLVFANSTGAAQGWITQANQTSVTYSTTSDARLKDDTGRATDLTALRAVVVHDFTWKADGTPDRGVFAQEAHALYPHAVTPGTDATTESGHLARPWMTDYSKFVPDLIVGWQHHEAVIAELRAALATLKGSPDAE